MKLYEIGVYTKQLVDNSLYFDPSVIIKKKNLYPKKTKTIFNFIPEKLL